MSWTSDDITFCANKLCKEQSCFRNYKNIKHPDIPHSFALFEQCKKWSYKGSEWFMGCLTGVKEESYETI